jgi:toxin ParE1/3/4
MARAIRYHPEFQSDAVQAAAWYDDRQAGLGSDFLAHVRNAVAELVQAPERRSAIDFGIRYHPLKRFPYVVFYDFTAQEVLVLGVMHTSQDAAKWRTRRH